MGGSYHIASPAAKCPNVPYQAKKGRIPGSPLRGAPE
jgi:hypothetical protein